MSEKPELKLTALAYTWTRIDFFKNGIKIGQTALDTDDARTFARVINRHASLLEACKGMYLAMDDLRVIQPQHFEAMRKGQAAIRAAEPEA